MPGCVEAPTKYTPWMEGCLVFGRKARTLKKEWERPRIEPLSRLNVDSQDVGVLSSSCKIKDWRFLHPVLFSIMAQIVLRVSSTIEGQSCSGSSPAPDEALGSPWGFDDVAEFKRCPVGTRTTIESQFCGAAVESIRLGTLT